MTVTSVVEAVRPGQAPGGASARLQEARFSGRVAIVTGGGSGIGRAIAHRLAAEGASVVLAGRREAPLQRVAEEVGGQGGMAVAVPADVSDESSVERLIEAALERFGRLDALVSNAAVDTGRGVPFHEMPSAAWEQSLQVNLSGAFYSGRAAAKHMVAQGYGRIVNVGAIQAQVPLPHNAAYAASKGGLISLTRSMAIDLAPHGIVVNAVAPGPVYIVAEDVPADVDQSAATLVRRAGRPAEVASLVAYLASEECSFVLGQTIVCDGGRLLSRRGDPDWI